MNAAAFFTLASFCYKSCMYICPFSNRVQVAHVLQGGVGICRKPVQTRHIYSLQKMWMMLTSTATSKQITAITQIRS